MQSRCLAAVVASVCRRRAFKRYVLCLLIGLGLYVLVNAMLKTTTQQQSRVLVPAARGHGRQSASLMHSRSGVSRGQGQGHAHSIQLTRNDTLSVSPHVLLLYDSQNAVVAKGMTTLLQSHRIPYDVHLYNEAVLPPLLVMSQSDRAYLRTPQSEQYLEPPQSPVGKYCLVVCADVAAFYGDWSERHRQHYLNYVKRFNVTLIHLAPSGGSLYSMEDSHVRPLLVQAVDVRGVKLNASRQFYYLKSDEWFTEITEADSFTAFLADSALAGVEVLAHMKIGRNASHEMTVPMAMVSQGWHGNRGVSEVLIGSPMEFWMTKLLVLEVIRSHSEHPLARFGRERRIMIDIDDIFVAPKGLKMTSADVEALIQAQAALRRYVPGLTFNLGFCGYFYDRGLPAENNGSSSLVQHKDDFWWFGHIFNHYQPHAISEENLRTYMKQNLDFARKFSIPSTVNSYSVSPHHSGVYPVFLPLYRAWVELLNVTMTTTEEYPHLYSSHKRRGYIYKGIMVLPRQTCHLFTHNYLFEEFLVGKGEDVGVAKRGKEGLRGVACGGEVFNTVLYNPVSIFMTHVTNYAKDRLAPFMFQHLFQFITRWTKLQLLTDRPLNLGKTYFSLFPEDRLPVWTSPCRDKRHMDIWPHGRNCSSLPSALILGPQKTGSTALQMFMSIHPNMSTSLPSAEKYEEVQFFSEEALYLKGIDWYMHQFPRTVLHSQLLFEKSATYFTHPRAPERIFSLLPKAKLIVILHDPVKRAYSWYQHMRAHRDEAAINHSFLDVLSSKLNHTHISAAASHALTPNHTHPLHSKLAKLREHCLNPGRYYQHLSRWFQWFPAGHLLFVDGEMLAGNPGRVMAAVQKFLKVDYLDYDTALTFSERKGHYCAVKDGRTQCLGPGKGRLYPALGSAESAYLKEYYKQQNSALAELLRSLKRPLPLWLA